MLRGLVCAGLAVVALVATGMVIRAADAPGTPAVQPKIVQASRFELVDSAGRIRGRFGLADDETPEVALLDADGKCRVRLKLSQAGEPGLELLDAQGKATFVAPPSHQAEAAAAEKKTATSSDVEAHGNWRREPGRHDTPDSYLAQGEVTNTGSGVAPFVTVTVTFKGATLVRLDSGVTFTVDDFVFAEASTVMRNLRPGETRKYSVSAPDAAYRSESAIVDARGRRFTARRALGGALDCAVSAVVTEEPAEPAR